MQQTGPTAETCDGLDNDCNGVVDDGNPGGGGGCSTGQPGVCGPGTVTCNGGSLVCVPNQTPGTEVCDGVDNDCDGQVDNGVCLTPTPSATRTATPTPSATPTPTRTPTRTRTPRATRTPTPTTGPHDCGNGVLEPTEQCDDGNLTDGDGCRSDCTYELIPGNGNGSPVTDQRACIVEFAVMNPTNAPPLDSRGRWNFRHTCQNNDPTCDFDLDSVNRTCEFHVVACLNNMDPQLPSCSQRGVGVSLSVRSPSALRDPVNHANLTAALQDLRDPVTGTSGHMLPVRPPEEGWCTAPFPIRVALNGTAPRPLRGRRVLQTVSLSYETEPVATRDVDVVMLTCMP
jgi:cysteine-rich repeat protein